MLHVQVVVLRVQILMLHVQVVVLRVQILMLHVQVVVLSADTHIISTCSSGCAA